MRVELVAHSSIVVETEDARILADPWFHGKAFNDSWSLLVEPKIDAKDLDAVTHLWISHEHPDHFHIPTLRSLPASFKERVTVLFQDNNSRKMFDALEKLGFRKFTVLPHRGRVRIAPQTEVYSYQVGLMDSALATMSGGKTVLNLNDCEVTDTDLGILRKDLGSPDILAMQYSVAGYNGLPEPERHLANRAREKLEAVVEAHETLGAGVTIPFASMVYFSTEDNRYVNDFANTPADVHEAMAKAGANVAILFNGDSIEIGKPHDSSEALRKWSEVYAGMDAKPYDTPKQVPVPEIRAAFEAAVALLHERYPKLFLKRLKPVTVHIPDLARTVRFSVPERRFEEDVPVGKDDADLVVYSQPLHFAFRWPWGVQTLGVSARFRVQRNVDNWREHRLVFGLNNAEVYLKPRLLFSASNRRWMRTRLRGGLAQVVASRRRM